MIKNGSWIVGRMEKGWTYPGQVISVVGDLVIFKVFDLDGSAYDTHRALSDIKLAKKSDFDRLVIEASNQILEIEEFVNKMYDIQTTVKE